MYLTAQVFVDFETASTTPEMTAEGDVSVVDNPDTGGINPSLKVGYYRKIDGNWHYVTMNFSQKIQIKNNNTLTFKVRCSEVGRVFAKFWNNGEVLIEDWAPEYNFKPSANEWTECTMDLTDAMNQEFDVLQIATVVDNDVAADVYFDDFSLSNPDAGDGSPIISYTVSGNKILVGESVDFDASASFDYDGTIESYNWDFGDGSTDTGVKVSHTYVTDSVYKTTLTLTDNDAKTSSKSTYIFVLPTNGKLSKMTLLTPSPETNKKVEMAFQINADYQNVYDPDEVKVDAEITLPDQSKMTVPCFYYEKGRFAKTDWAIDSSFRSWMLRFSSSQSGVHKVKLILADKDGTLNSDEYSVNIQTGNNKGFIRNDATNHQYYRYSTGEPYYPLGINVGWASTPTYTKTITNLGQGKANLIRYWQTPFAHQALEWKNDNFYHGLGRYSQEAAAMSDSLINLCEANGVNMQLTIFQHGMFSENVDAMWTDNPYNVANGGYIDRAEKYFYNDDCKKQTKKLLRYIVARWGYSTHLFAWEFFNEVQFTGINNSQTPAWYPAMLNWHSEMSQYVASIDPFNHIETTSAENSQLYDLDTVPNLDVVQYHLYSDNLLEDQKRLDTTFRENLQHCAIINGEYGTNALQADITFDNQRNSIWNGIVSQVPHLMWIWDHYTDATWANLFKLPAGFLASEDLALEPHLHSVGFEVTSDNSYLKWSGLQSDKNRYGYIYDPSGAASVSDAVVKLIDVPFANYTITYYLPSQGIVLDTYTVSLIKLTNKLELPDFQKDIAFKIKYLSEYTLPIAIAGNDTIVAPGVTVSFSATKSLSQSSNTLVYNWSLIEKPQHSSLTIEHPEAEEISIIPDVSGLYKLNLIVNDGLNQSLPDVVTILVSNVPVADAGNDTAVILTSKYYYFYLDGSRSYDADDDPLTYKWSLISKPDGSKGDLIGSDKLAAILKADVMGIYTIKLVVNDGVSDSKPDTVMVTVGETGINESSLQGLAIYPNPANDRFYISSDRLKGMVTIEILDASGRVLFKQESDTKQNPIEISLGSLSSKNGLVFVKLSTNQGIVVRPLLFLKE